MKQMERLIITACVLLALSLVIQYGSRSVLPILVKSLDMEPRQAITITVMAQNFFSLLVPLAIAGWLYREAKRDNQYPWVWVLLALTYQFIAPIFYVALKMYRSASTEPAGEQLPS